VRIGNISQGKIQCDNCKKAVPYSERYLIVKEKKGVESEDPDAEQKRLCVKCATQKGYVEARIEKGDKITTFFKGKITAPVVTDETEIEPEAALAVEPEAEKEE
jgi:ribosomal protein S26